MKNKTLLATVAGLAAIGAGVGAALVYLKKKQVTEDVAEETEEDITEEEFEATERTYTTLSDAAPAEEEVVEEATEEVVEEVAEETTEETAE